MTKWQDLQLHYFTQLVEELSVQHILMSGNAPEGFLKTVAGSAALHAVLLLAGLLLYKAEPERVFFSPVYTVSLVAGDAGKALSQPLKEPGPEAKAEGTGKAGEAQNLKRR
ncbi:MAG: hypothetical protein HZB21_05565 [Deltaproteobacteria bacterium]|nr:hypothetical protein [Deltaproteobacteria bacterium]